jgi:hypothetical protein
MTILHEHGLDSSAPSTVNYGVLKVRETLGVQIGPIIFLERNPAKNHVNNVTVASGTVYRAKRMATWPLHVQI